MKHLKKHIEGRLEGIDKAEPYSTDKAELEEIKKEYTEALTLFEKFERIPQRIEALRELAGEFFSKYLKSGQKEKMYKLLYDDFLTRRDELENFLKE